MSDFPDPVSDSRSSSYRAMEFGKQALIFLSIFYPLFLAISYLGTIENRMAYAYSHLFLNYSHGFARRSLYGSLFQSIPFISARMAMLLGYTQVLIAILLAYLVFARYFLDSFRDRLLFCFIFGGCGVLPHLGLLYGYLDVPLFSLLLITVFIIHAVHDHYAVALVLTSITTAIALLIHEAYLLMFYPVVFLLLLLKMKQAKWSRLGLALHCSFVVCAFCLIILHGNASINANEYFLLAKTRTNIPISDLVFGVMRGSFHGQFSDAIGFYSRPTTIVFMAVSVLASSPYLLVLWNLLSAAISGTQPQSLSLASWMGKLIPLLLAAPLLLIAVGFDFMRWLSCTCINVSIFVAYQFCFASNGDRMRAAIGRVAEKDWFVSGIFASMIIGPFGVVMGNRLTEKLFLLSSALNIHMGWKP